VELTAGILKDFKNDPHYLTQGIVMDAIVVSSDSILALFHSFAIAPGEAEQADRA